MPSRSIRVLALLADSCELDRLRSRLADLPAWAIEFHGASTRSELLEELALRRFDLAFLGDKVERGSGLEVLADMRRMGLATPVIVLASGAEPSAASAARAGAAARLPLVELAGCALDAAMEGALEREKPPLPVRERRSPEELFQNLSRDIGSTLEAARASLSCVLAEGYLSEEQRLQLCEARELCKRALGELDGLLSIAGE